MAYCLYTHVASLRTYLYKAFLQSFSVFLIIAATFVEWERRHDLQIKQFFYCITCPTCKPNYIRQTGKIRASVRFHNLQICHPNLRQTLLSKHLDICVNVKLNPFSFYNCRRDNEDYGEVLEKRFRKTFKAKLNPKGITPFIHNNNVTSHYAMVSLLSYIWGMMILEQWYKYFIIFLRKVCIFD